MEILNGFGYLFSSSEALLFVVLGAIVGVVVGALPGLTAAAAIAMLLPISFHLEPLSALAFLYVIGKSGRFGGSISAILFNTPGTAASAATMKDGFPMTQQGKPKKALRIATIASVFGDTVGELTLIFGAAAIAAVTINFGPPEYFAIYAMAFVIIGSVVGKSIFRGILSTLLGAFVSLVGTDPIAGISRMTVGIYELENGLNLVPVLIGVFVVSEIFTRLEPALINEKSVSALNLSKKSEDHFSMAEFIQCLPVMIRSSVMGTIIGIMPGLGSSVACFVAYGEEKRRSKTPEKWGTGISEGIAAPESANNAVSGPSMIPLLTLGVPGSTIAAILIGVFVIHGIQVGPSIFVNQSDLIFGLFAAGLLGIACYGIIGYFCAPMIGRVINLMPNRYIYPFIFITAFVAAYSARQSAFDVLIALLFGVVGYIMRRYDFSAAAFVIAFVLAKGAEEAFRQSILLSDSGYFVFFERPVAVGFLLLGSAVFGGRIYAHSRRKVSSGTSRN